MTPSRPGPVARPRKVAALDPFTHALCRYAAAMSRGDDELASAALLDAKAAGGRRRAAEETALMLMLYAGYPGALEGLRVLNAAWPGRAKRSREGTPASWRKRGQALCHRVYGSAYDRLIPAVTTLHPDLAVWMEEHGYGRVLGRRGLGVIARELITVSSLAALGWERQLVSHVLGARRVGASDAAVEMALVVGAAAGDERAQRIAARTFERVRRTASARG